MKRTDSFWHFTSSVAIVVACHAPSTRGQGVLLRWDGDHSADGLGSSISALPDVTADGVPEILVGVINDDCGGTDFGGSYVYSGKDGTTSFVECGTGIKDVGEGFGRSVSGVVDVDGDGTADWIVGGYGYISSLGAGTGRVCVYLGKSGAFLYQVEGEQIGNGFGWSVAGLGDVDGDGRGDFVACAPYFSNTTPSNIGRAYVFSKATSTRIRFHEGEHEYDLFGWNCAGLGDVDADGVPDYAVMAVLNFSIGAVGAVYVYSGASGNALYKWTGDSATFNFGYGLEGHLDWNGDGYGDVLVGAPGGLSTDGDVFIYSGKDGTTLANVKGEDAGVQFGYSIANVGDMDGDGYAEILVGEPLNSELDTFSGRATLLSGRTLRRLYHFYGAGVSDVMFGLRVAGGQDYNGDGIPDVLISEPWPNSQGPIGGRVTLFAGNDLFLQAIPNSVTANDTIRISTRGGPPGVLSVLVITGVNGAPYFLPIKVDTLDANGEMGMKTTVPSGLAGATVTLQSFAQHAAGKKGYIDSDRETVTIH